MPQLTVIQSFNRLITIVYLFLKNKIHDFIIILKNHFMFIFVS